MFPKMNPKQMKRMMKQMGVEMEEMKAEKVIIETPEGDIVIDEPNVAVVTAMGQKTYQITGSERVEKGIPKADIKLVAEQAKASEEEARGALEETDGDLAKAILLLSEK